MKFPCDLETWLGGGASAGVQRSNLLRNNLYVRFCLYTVPPFTKYIDPKTGTIQQACFILHV